MARPSERVLVSLAVLISLVLTGLTVWAVGRQGRALQEREWTDLRRSAAQAAETSRARLDRAVTAALEQAGQALLSGGADELDAWVGEQREWLLALHDAGENRWSAYPLTLLERPPSLPATPEFQLAQEIELGEQDLRTALARYRQLAESHDALTRGPALLAAAACQAKLGLAAEASAAYADAAETLRSTPRTRRLALGATLARLDLLLRSGQRDTAADLVRDALDELARMHPAAASAAELGLLRRRVEMFSGDKQHPALAARLAEIERAAAIRGYVPGLLAEVSRRFGGIGEDADGISYVPYAPRDSERMVIAVGALPAGTRLALVAPPHALLERCLSGDESNRAWRPGFPGEGAGPVLAELGPGFGGAVLMSTDAAAARMEALSDRRLILLVSIAFATAAAWGVVMWMMLRVMARQRELVTLQKRFVADVSHELKTPLALIRLMAETLCDRRIREPERMHSYHETIARESERLTVLLDSILDFSRIESGKRAFEFVDCDVGQLAAQAWALFEPQFAAEGFERYLEIAPDLPHVRADAQALQQVVVNLLQNAIRYAGDGKYVKLTVGREGFLVVITVEDRGIGMSRQQLQRLGDSFYRAEDTRVRRTRGTGLGLAIVNHIVTAHKGKIEVHSRPGQGSKFTVWFPYEPEKAGARG